MAINGKGLGVALAFYFGSYGVNAGLDSVRGYNTLEYGLKNIDKKKHYVLKTGKPTIELLLGETKASEIINDQHYLQDNQSRIATNLDKATRIIQPISILYGFLTLFGFGKKEE